MHRSNRQASGYDAFDPPVQLSWQEIMPLADRFAQLSA
jgi:hypothetical protein